MSAIHIASAKGDSETVLRLQAEGAALDETDEDGLTPLHWASYRGHRKIVSFLLENGACVEGRNPGGYSPLMVASREGHVNIVPALLRYGANPNATEATGLSAVFFAAGYSKKREVLEALLTNDGDPNASVERTGATPLMWSAGAGLADNVRTLIAFGADTSCVDVRGRTAVDWAQEKERHRIVGLLSAHASLPTGQGPNPK